MVLLSDMFLGLGISKQKGDFSYARVPVPFFLFQRIYKFGNGANIFYMNWVQLFKALSA